jgi:Icc-related predicted phosphoesterase
MRILAIADYVDPVLYEYFDPARWADIDLVISCGDVPPGYLDFLLSTLNRPVLYVRGNHDGGYPADAYAGCYNVNGRVWRGEGLAVIGFEGCRRYNTGPVQYSERQMRYRIWRSTWFLRGIDLIVAHAPPLGCHDRPDPCHTGFACFDDLIRRLRPRYFIHGHSHLYGCDHRVARIGSTLVVNAYGHYVFDVTTPQEDCASATGCTLRT